MSREKFEAWMTEEQWFHDSDFEWDDRRNCYSQFGIHLAYKAWQAATKHAEAKCAALASEREAAEKRITELEAREVVLPDYTEIYQSEFAKEVEHQVRAALKSAGIITKVEE